MRGEIMISQLTFQLLRNARKNYMTFYVLNNDRYVDAWRINTYECTAVGQ